uniref:Histone-lysine N-methyltransferase SETMAR n=1 Tax=Mesocestoides corti TaxID=53468 RepID=A0A5K3G1Z5_MESCO
MQYNHTVREELLQKLNPGCKCEGSCIDKHVCACIARSQGCNYDVADNSLLQLQSPRSTSYRPVFECNSRCSCRRETCRNRVVQIRCHDTSAIIPCTTGSKGVGAVASRSIREAEFVCVYYGQYMIPHVDNARARAAEQLARWNHVYVMVVNEFVNSSRLPAFTTVVDGAYNVTDSPTSLNPTCCFNHSCEPNMTIMPIRVDTMMPVLALFTLRDIRPHEELTYNYFEKSGEIVQEAGKECLCGTSSCVGHLPFCI